MWQRAQLGDLDDPDSPIAAQLAYWEQMLAGMPERIDLPTDRPYPPVADQRGARMAISWPAELQQRVARVARSTTRPASWWCRPPWRCCWPSSAPAARWRLAFRLPGAAILS
ncbi:condensation domain protein [Mycobacterium xenopi 4042]|uniref:Condensation domain protein n=1 Tax=Mycobacterium xenopi 4042 TaxID=1299334 RepID=X8AM51_MYCXE|nr:condensation domain protein [Mycobacterium xenopi 4042]